jgi:histone H3/H4
MSTTITDWRVCNMCKKPITFEQNYYVCSVSTCNRKRTDFVFCAVSCWDAHVPVLRHRDAWAEERRAPSRTVWEREQQSEQEMAAAKAQTMAVPRQPIEARRDNAGDLPQDILIVVSKVKHYIKQHSAMNTSDTVTSVLSDHLRELCEQAIANAAQDGRKTVMDRDFLPLLRQAKG